MLITRAKRRLLTAYRIFHADGLVGLTVTIKRKWEAPRKKRDIQNILSKASLAERFTEIDRLRYWHSPTNRESRSGDGSTLAFAEGYTQRLSSYLDSLHFEDAELTFFDAPCGDLNWIQPIAYRRSLTYIGGDIVPSIISSNSKKHASAKISFIVFDITQDPFPDALIWHCRDCLIHLSYANILRALRNFVSSNVNYLIVTCHHLPDHENNRDIEDGDFRRVDLRKAPFKMPEPITKILDSPPNTNIERYSYVYERGQISDWLQNTTFPLE